MGGELKGNTVWIVIINSSSSIIITINSSSSMIITIIMTMHVVAGRSSYH